MEISIEKIGDVTVAVVPMEQLGAENSSNFKCEIAPVLEANTRLALDLSALRFVDSSGLSAMLSCLRQLSAKSGDLKLFGMTNQIRSHFELVRMHHIVEIYGTKEEAVRAFQT